MANKDINRIKVILVEKKKTAKWLAGELGKDPATVSKWCTNVSQPSLDTLVEVSKALGVDVRELLVSTREEPKYIRVEGWQTKDKQKKGTNHHYTKLAMKWCLHLTKYKKNE